MKTKCNGQRIDKIRRKLGFHFFVVVDSIGLSGGLALLWKNEVDITVQVLSNSMLQITWKSKQGYVWRLFYYYCPFVPNLKDSFSHDLNVAIDFGQEDQVCIGNFNDVVSKEEKQGGKHFNPSESFLKMVMNDLGALDLGFIKNVFTQSNTRLEAPY